MLKVASPDKTFGYIRHTPDGWVATRGGEMDDLVQDIQNGLVRWNGKPLSMQDNKERFEEALTVLFHYEIVPDDTDTSDANDYPSTVSDEQYARLMQRRPEGQPTPYEMHMARVRYVMRQRKAGLPVENEGEGIPTTNYPWPFTSSVWWDEDDGADEGGASAPSDSGSPQAPTAAAEPITAGDKPGKKGGKDKTPRKRDRKSKGSQKK